MFKGHCIVYTMEFRGKFGIFLEFLRQKYEEYEKTAVKRNHLDWKGDETADYFNNTEVLTKCVLNINLIF